jgi:hypothetical protein
MPRLFPPKPVAAHVGAQLIHARVERVDDERGLALAARTGTDGYDAMPIAVGVVSKSAFQRRPAGARCGS